MKLIGLIAVMFALTTLRWHARPHLWRAALVAALCAPLAGVMPTARALEPSSPASTDVVDVSNNAGNSRHPQIASKTNMVFTHPIEPRRPGAPRLHLMNSIPVFTR